MLRWFTKNDKNGSKLLINYVEQHERDIITLVNLLLVSKTVAVKVNNILQQFYSISYLRAQEGLTSLQLSLLKVNSSYFSNHGSWFIACSKHNNADVIKLKANRLSCSFLKCPEGCREKISILQAMELIVIAKVGVEVKRNIVTSFMNLYYSLVPYYNWWLILEVGIISSWYIKIATDDELVIYTFYGLNYLASISDNFKNKLDLFLSYAKRPLIKLLESLENTLNLVKIVLDDPSLYNRYKLKINELEHSPLVTERIIESLILNIGSNDKVLWFRTKNNRFIFTERNALTYSCVSSCINALLRLTDMQYTYPKFILLSLTHGEYILTAEDSLTTPKNLWETYSSITALALYTVISFIFGVEEDAIIWRKDSFFPFLFSSELCSSENLNVSAIIWSLGGRRSDLYFRYINRCTEIFLSFRKHFMVILLLIEPIKVQRSKLESKLNPRKTEAQATRVFIDCIDKNANNSLGVWKYIGY